MNSLFNQYNAQQNNQMLSQLSSFINAFKGDPKQQVQQLLNTGRMSQAQFNQFSQQATQIRNLFK